MSGRQNWFCFLKSSGLQHKKIKHNDLARYISPLRNAAPLRQTSHTPAPSSSVHVASRCLTTHSLSIRVGTSAKRVGAGHLDACFASAGVRYLVEGAAQTCTV